MRIMTSCKVSQIGGELTEIDNFKKFREKLMQAHPEYFKKAGEKVEKGDDFMKDEAVCFLVR
jgi:hypothetical protein